MRILNEYGVNKGDGSLNAKNYRVIACVSGEMAAIDTGDLAGGSRVTATDTGASYVFNEQSGTWTEESSGGSGGTTVVANPTLAGTEADLTGLQVGSTKYKVPSGGSSNVLVVNATIDFDRVESEEEHPLILDKTMAEMIAAENTVMSIDTGEGYYILTETYRYSADGSGSIFWAGEMDGLKFGAQAILDDGVLSAVLGLSGEGGGEPDETDEFTVYNTQYMGFYTASTAHAVTNPEDAKQAIFTFNFQYGTANERLSGTTEARLVSRTEGTDIVTLVYEAIVEKNSELWFVTVTSVDSNGSRTNTVSVVRYPVGTLVLHGTMTGSATGTIQESTADLLAAIQADKRIILKFENNGTNATLDMSFRYIYVDGDSAMPSADGFFRYSEQGATVLAVIHVQPYAQDTSALVMDADYFTLTPFVGS